MSPEEILAQARSAAARAKRNLDSTQKKIRVGFLRKKEKGDISYALTEDKFRVKTETAIEKTKERSEKAYLHIAAKPLSSITPPSLPLKEETLKEEAFDLFDNRKRFLKEMSASLKPKEKPVDKVFFGMFEYCFNSYILHSFSNGREMGPR